MRGIKIELRDIINIVSVVVLVCALFWRAFSTNTQNSDYSYVPAEVIASNDTSVFFETGHGIYAIDADADTYPDTVPYLLHMDNCGTPEDKTDDAIIVVWRVAE